MTSSLCVVASCRRITWNALQTQLDTFVLSLPAFQLKIESRVRSRNVSLTSSHIMPSKVLTPFICKYRGYRWPPDFSVSPHYVPFSSSLLFGNRSERLAAPHTQDTRMTRNGQMRSSTKLEQKSWRVHALCRSHTSCHQEDLAARAYPDRRSALDTGGHHLRKAGPSFWASKTENEKGAHMQKGGSQLSPLFLFLHTLIDSPHAYGILPSNLQKTRWTVDSCDSKKVGMTASKDAPTEIHCSE